MRRNSVIFVYLAASVFAFGMRSDLADDHLRFVSTRPFSALSGNVSVRKNFVFDETSKVLYNPLADDTFLQKYTYSE